MSILCIAALLVGIMLADLQSKSPKKGEKKPGLGTEKPKGEEGKKPDLGDDKPKGEDAKKPISLNDIQGEMTFYVSTKKSKG